jgi:O-antigen/teichoic acid export membrane protein
VAGPVADVYGTSALEWPIRLAAIAILGHSFFALLDQVFEAHGRVALFVRIAAAESVVETVASIGLVLAGLGVSGAMAGRAAAYVFAAGLGIVLLVRSLALRPSLVRGSGNARRLLGYGSALLIVDGAFILFHRIDVLLIGAILSVKAVGQFEAPMRLMTILGYVGSAVATGVAPRLAAGRDRLDPARLIEALRGLMAIQGLFIAPLLVWAEPITELVLGSEYTDSADVLRAITPYMFLIAISPVLARGVNYMGEAKRRIPIAIGALSVNLVFDLIFLSEIGIVAGAIGTDIAYTLYVLAHLWICKSLIGFSLAPLGIALMRVLLAAAGMAGVLLAFGTGEVALPLLIAGSIAGTAVYAALLVALREIGVADLVGLAKRVRAGGG